MSSSIGAYTTFGIGGSARRIITARSAAQLIDRSPDSLVLGRGSNVLVSDAGYDGDVIINRFESFDVSHGLCTVGSGMSLVKLCCVLGEYGLSGLEWACGIPGSVGGAIRMNAGAFGHSVSETFEYADVVKCGEVRRMYRDDLMFGYRRSGLCSDDVVLCAAFRMSTDTAANVAARCEAYRAARKASQPQGKSAGSVFINPPGVKIGAAIESLGFKGYRVGGAEISAMHANVIVNVGGATARDVVTLINTVRTALSGIGIDAHEEIIYIGEF